MKKFIIFFILLLSSTFAGKFDATGKYDYLKSLKTIYYFTLDNKPVPEDLSCELTKLYAKIIKKDFKKAYEYIHDF